MVTLESETHKQDELNTMKLGNKFLVDNHEYDYWMIESFEKNIHQKLKVKKSQ